ncbi:hypothetical protein [Promicromonospora sp. NPDC050880]|uniref:hypothetical protein n=1 Tax=Promicromonospora sp. NPDC050880 TaxID=3364406 RepID=UPI0037B813F5
MCESSAGHEPGQGTVSPVDAAFGALLDELFAGPRVTYAPVGELPLYHSGHRRAARRHRRFVLRAGTDLDDPR